MRKNYDIMKTLSKYINRRTDEQRSQDRRTDGDAELHGLG